MCVSDKQFEHEVNGELCVNPTCKVIASGMTSRGIWWAVLEVEKK